MDSAALKNQAFGFARGGVWFAAGAAFGAGYIHGDTAITIAGSVIAAGAAAWSGAANTNGSITSAFSQIPEVKGIETSDPKLAETAKIADPSTKVKVVAEGASK